MKTAPAGSFDPWRVPDGKEKTEEGQETLGCEDDVLVGRRQKVVKQQAHSLDRAIPPPGWPFFSRFTLAFRASLPSPLLRTPRRSLPAISLAGASVVKSPPPRLSSRAQRGTCFFLSPHAPVARALRGFCVPRTLREDPRHVPAFPPLRRASQEAPYEPASTLRRELPPAPQGNKFPCREKFPPSKRFPPPSQIVHAGKCFVCCSASERIHSSVRPSTCSLLPRPTRAQLDYGGTQDGH